MIKLALGKVIAEDGFSVVKNVLDTNNIDLLIQKIALAANSLFAKQRHKSIYCCMVFYTHRPVLHLEYSAINLPYGLEWCD